MSTYAYGNVAVSFPSPLEGDAAEVARYFASEFGYSVEHDDANRVVGLSADFDDAGYLNPFVDGVLDDVLNHIGIDPSLPTVTFHYANTEYEPDDGSILDIAVKGGDITSWSESRIHMEECEPSGDTLEVVRDAYARAGYEPAAGGGSDSCPYCDGVSNPQIQSCHLGDGRMLFCIRGNTLVMRALDQQCVPQWLLDVKYCPACGRKLGQPSRR